VRKSFSLKLARKAQVIRTSLLFTPVEALADISTKFFTILDAMKGYHQCPLDPDSQLLTTFITQMADLNIYVLLMEYINSAKLKSLLLNFTCLLRNTNSENLL